MYSAYPTGYAPYTERQAQAGETKQNDKFATRKQRNRTPSHKLHIWFFADTLANAKKPKEQFFANALAEL